MKEYHCAHCVACDEIDHPEQPPEYVCKFDNKVLEFDIHTKIPCTRFQPEEYIESLNYDIH